EPFVCIIPILADDLPPVTGDRVQLQQVVLNLLLNASDAMSGVDDRPRQLVIRTERNEGDRVRLAVQDAGVGVEPQAVDKLFEPFYTTKSGGMGIGLSVSRSIIESHNGRLWAAPHDGPGAASRTGFVDHRFPDSVGFENEFHSFADGAVACMSFRRVVRGVFDLRDGVAHSNGEASAVHSGNIRKI